VNFIYFLLSGEASFVSRKYDNKSIVQLSEGDMFGEIDLLPFKQE